MTYTTVSKCGNDHSTWLKELDFYNEELSLLEKRLLEIADKNNGKEVMAEVEHFQNQFIVQRNNIILMNITIKWRRMQKHMLAKWKLAKSMTTKS